MKPLLVLLSLVLFPWGTFSQAWGQCVCSDKETISINLAYNKGALAVAKAALPDLKNPEVVSFANVAIKEHEAIIKDLERIIIDAGLPEKPNDIGKAFEIRGKEALANIKGLKGTNVDQAYIEYFNNEIGLLITAFDTYFIPKVVTPTMKEWVEQERPKLEDQSLLAKSVRAKVVGGSALFAQ